MHFAIVSPPVRGHINPFSALGRELQRRGHRVTFIHMQDLEDGVRREGLGFHTIGQRDHPVGSLPESLAQLGRLQGFAALRFTIDAVRKTTEMMCRDLPRAIESEKIDGLVVDQTEPAGGTVAEHLGIPFVTVCNALALNRDPYVPPPFTPWRFHRSRWARLRNTVGYAVSDRLMAPVTATLGRYRRQWNLPPLKSPDDAASRLAQISQQTAAFDFPRERLPDAFHYVGPLRDPVHQEVDFPWNRLDGRPLIYASLGTLQNGKERIFRCFAEACAGLPVQLVITHGGGLNSKAAGALAGNPIIVPYAPQLRVLQHCSLTLTHAGLNTVLDSLTCGVPVLAVPITYEQPAIAARLEWTGAGSAIGKLAVRDLRRRISGVLEDSQMRQAAGRIADSIRQAGGVRKAADIVEGHLV